MRPSLRAPHELRPLHFERNYTAYAEGSVLVTMGGTRVLCTATVEPGVPKFLRDSKQGWLTAEYGMLPRATHQRTQRDGTRAHPAGRSVEIQRLIGRSLRSVLNFHLLGEYTITIDCDVLQADGGTRTAAINGGMLALSDAINVMLTRQAIRQNPIKYWLGAVSAGIYQGVPVLDLDYAEDSNAHTDMNFVLTETGQIVEIQATAERDPLSETQLHELIVLAKQGILEIIQKQKQVT